MRIIIKVLNGKDCVMEVSFLVVTSANSGCFVVGDNRVFIETKVRH